MEMHTPPAHLQTPRVSYRYLPARDSDARPTNEHFTTRGHEGEVKSVSVSPDCRYIVSGGVDCTMRVWCLAEEFPCYLLKILVTHKTVVNVVAAAGNDGPAFSGTTGGDVYILCWKQIGLASQTSLHQDGVTDLRVQPGRESIILATASIDTNVKLLKVEALQHANGPFRVTLLRRLQHASALNAIRFVSRGNNDFISIATCTNEVIRFWSPQGDDLGMVEEPWKSKNSHIWALEVARDARMIMAAGSGIICIWALNSDGSVGESEPLVTYHSHDVSIVALDHSNRFVVDTRENVQAVAWGLRPSCPELAVGTSPLTSSLVSPGSEEILSVVWHPSTVLNLCVGMTQTDPSEARLVSCCENGQVFLTDLEGDDAGEFTAELRSLSLVELYKPMILLCCSFVQISAFAFKPSVPWVHRVKQPGSTVMAISTLDIANLHYKIDIEKVFWPKMYSVVFVMLLFVSVAIFDIDRLLTRWARRVQTTPTYIKEQDDARYGPMRLQRHAILGFRKSIRTIMMLSSTLMVVPIVKACANAMQCVDAQGGSPHVLEAPQVACYQGRHKTLGITLGVVCPMFVLILVPFAVVNGDSTYVQRSDLFSWKAWRANAMRKAHTLYLGPMHPGPYALRTAMFELAAKILVPVTDLSLSKAREEMVVLSGVCLAVYIATLIWAPLQHPSSRAIFRGMRLFTSCIMLCGFFTAYLDDSKRHEPLWALVFVVVLVPTITYCNAIAVHLPDPEKSVHRLHVRRD